MGENRLAEDLHISPAECASVVVGWLSEVARPHPAIKDTSSTPWAARRDWGRYLLDRGGAPSRRQAVHRSGDDVTVGHEGTYLPTVDRVPYVQAADRSPVRRIGGLATALSQNATT